jgi:hypothetical protein
MIGEYHEAASAAQQRQQGFVEACDVAASAYIQNTTQFVTADGDGDSRRNGAGDILGMTNGASGHLKTGAFFVSKDDSAAAAQTVSDTYDQ